jgi:hypothetical protein
MNKAAIICKLHEITDHYLFGGGIWPPHWEFRPAFFKTVRELGLYEDVPDSPSTTRLTALGNELKLDLAMAFVGAFDLWDIPYVLESNGYLEESEAEELCWGPLTQAERKLHGYVLRAYFRFYNRSKPLN